MLIKSVRISNSKKLELSINDNEIVVKVEGFIHEKRVCTHMINVIDNPMSEHDALEKYKYSF